VSPAKGLPRDANDLARRGLLDERQVTAFVSPPATRSKNTKEKA
jgi:hypothetical protein